MTTIQIITNTEFKNQYQNKTGSLMFPSVYYDCLGMCDRKLLRELLPNPLPKGTRILKVLVHTDASPEYKNIANRLIPYKSPACADSHDDGAYLYTSRHGFSMWAIDNPLGDAIVVVNKPL